MEKENENIEQVERYVSGEMNASEQEDFVNQLPGDTVLQEEYQLQASVIHQIRKSDESEARQAMYTLLEKHKHPRVFQIRYWAAAIAILMVGTIIFVMPFKNQDRLSRFYTPYPGTSLERGSEDIKDTFYAYSAGQFSQALPGLVELESSEGPSPKNQLMIGSCYLALADFPTALNWFKKVRKSNNMLLREHGIWYESLTLIKMGHTAKAIDQLDSLSKHGQYYQSYILQLKEAL